MSRLRPVSAEKAPKPLPQFSQAVIYGDLVFCSGNIGIAPETGKLIDGGIKNQTVGLAAEKEPLNRPMLTGWAGESLAEHIGDSEESWQ